MADDDKNGVSSGDGGAGAPPKDESATYLSRIAGLDAKVTTLTDAQKAAEARALAAEQKLAQYETGKVNADEALRAQLAAKDAELATERKQAALARVEAKFPETYALLGEATASMAPEVLAATEARLKGVTPEDDDSPTPELHNESKARNGAATGKKTLESLSADDVEKALLSGPAPDWMRTS